MEEEWDLLRCLGAHVGVPLRLDPQTKGITRVAPGTDWIMAGISLSADASTVAFMGSGPKQFPEVFVAPLATMAAKKLTDASAQVASWPQRTPELITWKSKDGTAIEGVLHKPAELPDDQAVSVARRDPRGPHRHLEADTLRLGIVSIRSTSS